jgi:hypothetical protein
VGKTFQAKGRACVKSQFKKQKEKQKKRNRKKANVAGLQRAWSGLQ